MIKNILVVPDVHGRDFWKKPVEDFLKYDNCHIIFLGDYLDPYAHEWANVMEDGKPIDYRQHAIDNFKEIIELKKNNADKITLLIGNHDCEYMLSTEVCDCRCDRKNYDEIRELFKTNWELFQMCDEEYVDDKHYIFSHSGIEKEWLECTNMKKLLTEPYNEENIVDTINNIYKETMNEKCPGASIFAMALSQVDYMRGGWNIYGSMVWADARGFASYVNTNEFGYQVFGHTQMENEYICSKFACLDARKAFIINENGLEEWKEK